MSFLIAQTPSLAQGRSRRLTAGKKEDVTQEQFPSDRKGMWKDLLVVQGESSRTAILKMIWGPQDPS